MDPTRTAYGTWSGGRFMNFGESLNDDRYLAAIRRAYENGIRTFLTADVYGAGEADELLGRALADVPRDSWCLVGAVGHDFYHGEREGSKGFPRFTDPALRGADAYAGYLRMAAEKSLGRLGQSRFDLLLLHNPDETGYTSDEVWKGMAKLKDAGLTDMLGIAPGPANGFTLDIIGAFEKFGDAIDWAMIILNPFEPWPGQLCLPAAEKHGVKIITRVVDYGGVFFDDVKAGHLFARMDHRTFRPAGWVEAAEKKLEAVRPIAQRHGISMIQLACQWNLAHPAVESVVPTVIQESGEGARPIEEKIDELAALPEDVRLTAAEVEEIRRVGDNTGCMPLKGGSRQYQGKPQADQWPINGFLEDVAARWKINPDRDLYHAHDPRDLREKGMPKHGVPQAMDRRLFVELHAFTGATADSIAKCIDALQQSGLDTVLYADVHDPRGIAVLVMTENADDLAGTARVTLSGAPFASLQPQPHLTMLGRTYGFGREPDVEHWLLRRPIDHAMNPEWPWAVWYPLRRKGAFYSLPKRDQSEILREHGSIGFNYGGAGYAGDIRLACFGIDREDNEFVLGLMSPRLEWLSRLVEDMRPTVQTSQYIEKLGPFFVGKVLFRSREEGTSK